MSRPLDLLLSALMLPVWLISRIWRKDADTWIFGAWQGCSYSDNSRYLFEYALEHTTGKTIVWQTSSDAVYEDLSARGLPVQKAYSLEGFLTALKAGKLFVSSGLADVNRYAANAPVKTQLWHGSPLKKIGDHTRDPLARSSYAVLRRLLPFFDPPYTMMCAPSEKIGEIFRSAFPRVQRIEITGYPRNDMLVEAARESTDRKLVLYMPTFRQYEAFDMREYFDGFDKHAIQNQLAELGAELVLKLHPAMQDVDVDISGCDRIRMASKTSDAQIMLVQASVLITDYSSAYFDFLLKDQPIIFHPFDLEKFLAHDRGFYFDYNDVTPGPHCTDWKEIGSAMQTALSEPSKYRAERTKVATLFNAFKDANSKQRVLDLLVQSDSRRQS